MTASGNSVGRLESLDQFRGYAVVGMLLVNYFSGYAACPQILRHTNDYCSYADTIMPAFLFAVGFAFRLTLGRRLAEHGSLAAYLRMARRLLGLVLVSLVVYTVSAPAASWEQLRELGIWEALRVPLKRDWFQTLMHIAVTSLWILPVVSRPARIRMLWLLASVATHVWLSYWFNFSWVNTSPQGIDGGPLGFLTWSLPAITGTLACDIFVQPTQRVRLAAPRVWQALTMSIAFMLVGYGASCATRLYDVDSSASPELVRGKFAPDAVWPTTQRIQAKLAERRLSAWLAEPPFVKPPGHEQRQWNYWMMSQRAGTLSYLTFASGFSLLVFLLFHIVCDVYGLQLSLFRTFGTNALLAYVLHEMVSRAVQPFFPKDSPSWYAISGLLLFLWITWAIVRHMEKQNVFLRV